MEKPTQAAIDLFEGSLPDDERVERKKMFGMPAAFVNGNMFWGVFENGVVGRVGEARRDALSVDNGIEPFEPMTGRPWKEYVHIDAAEWSGRRDDVCAWAQEALEFAALLPAKEKKRKKAK